MNLLFSITDNFTKPLLTTLFSIRMNSPNEKMDVYVLQKELLENDELIRKFCHEIDMEYFPLVVGDNIFNDAPASERWPESIDYRLLAH